MKTCTGCGASKHEVDFYVKKKSIDGRCSRCKECCLVVGRKYREANLEKIRAYAKEYRASNRDKLNAKSRAWALANYDRSRSKQKEWYLSNKDRVRTRQREWRESNRDQVRSMDRRQHLRKKYGLTVSQVDGLLAACGGRCQICGRSPSEMVEKRKVLCVDHCHSTGTVRGILCGGCNAAIGRLGDNAVGVRRALEYLEKFESKE